VRLPFKQQPPSYQDSERNAKKRFQGLENKLLRNPTLKKAYVEFMTDYEDLGHMSVTNEDTKCFIPHHAVFKANKIRVVFDASTKNSEGAINDVLLIGPKLQRDIRNIVMNFRCHKYVFVSDIVKMYRNILLDEQDRPYQHILWRNEMSKGIEKFELNTSSQKQPCCKM